MLVLTRKSGQSVYIGENIKVVIHGVRGNQVRMGIEAPNNVRIYREEIFHQILEENQSAATDLPADLLAVAKFWADGRSNALADLKTRKLKTKTSLEEDSEDEE
jgi:carbon storage regulator